MVLLSSSWFTLLIICDLSHRPTLYYFNAGEDEGRLATLAKEFGLSRTRAPKSQIRERVSDGLETLNLSSLKQWFESMALLDEDFSDMWIQSVYSAHSDQRTFDESVLDEGEGLLKSGRGELPVLREEEGDEPLEIEKGGELDAHAADLGGTLSSATLGIIKGMVGPAILYLPHGFASAGYLVAVPVLLLSTVLFLWSSECLLESWKMESDRLNNTRHRRRSSKPQRVMLSYPELAYRSFGSTGETIVKVGISMMQSGVCLTYLIFVPQNLHTSALLLLNWDISTNWCLAAMMAVQIPLSQIRDIRKLTVTNLLANMLILYGLITCLGFALNSMGSSLGDASIAGSSSHPFIHEVVHRFESLPPFNSSGWFLFMGTSVLLFEGSITLLVPLQEAVQKPSDRRKFPSLYRKVILGIVTFYTFFGLTCWVAFGDNVRTVMTTR